MLDTILWNMRGWPAPCGRDQVKFLCFAVSSAVLVFLSPTLCFGQASQAEMESFSMPPPSGYVAEKTFSYVGDYGYYTAPQSSVPGSTYNASDYKYVHYSGVDGRKVYVYGTWGTTEIPPPQIIGRQIYDSCFHAHAS